MVQYDAPPQPGATLSSITTATSEIAAVAADVVTAEADIVTNAAAAAANASDVDDLETAVGTYAGGEDLSIDVADALAQLGTAVTVSTETEVWAALTALEVRIAALEGA